MLESLIYFSPILTLLCGISALIVGRGQQKEIGWNFRVTKITVFVSFLAAIIFYNKSPFPQYTEANLFTSLFEILLYLAVLAVLFLSRKWYASMNIDGHLFCEGILLSLVASNLLIGSQNLGLTMFAILLIMQSNYLLFNHADKKKELYTGSRIYAFSASFIASIMIGCGALIYWKCGSFDYETLAVFVDVHREEFAWFCAMSALVLVFVFMLGLAPLHFWYTETLGQVILPVFAYFILVPISACWAGLIRFNVVVLASLQTMFADFYMGIALISLCIGALGTCSAKSVRKIFAYGSVYNLAIVWLMLQDFSPEALNNAFIYLFVYMLSLYGICASLFGIKSKGEYLFMLSEFEGAAAKRPYISAMMTVFLFSLIGFPPFLGFLGILSVLNDLSLNGYFYQIAVLLVSMLVIAYAYLQIVKTLYFDESDTSFDRADIGIYVAVLLTLLLMIVIMLNPHYLVRDISFMLKDVYRWLM